MRIFVMSKAKEPLFEAKITNKMPKLAKICCRTCFFACVVQKKAPSLQRYPENNLFTLKKLIPIENKKGVFVKRFLFYFIFTIAKYAYITVTLHLHENPTRLHGFFNRLRVFIKMFSRFIASLLLFS